MPRVVVGFTMMALLLGSATSAHAETPGVGPEPCVTAPVIDVAAEQRAFEREMALFERRWELTQRLVAQREARAFEEAEARYVRFAELTKKLAEDAAAEAERQFDAAVTLFVQKRELTQSLAASPRSPEPAAPGAAPAPDPAHVPLR